MKMFRNDKGFTLVELMVVVLIIGILIAIAIPVFNTAKAKAAERACFASERTMEGAAVAYQADNGSLPTVLAQLEPSYIKTVPKCPGKDGVEGKYTIDASGTVTCDQHGHF